MRILKAKMKEDQFAIEVYNAPNTKENVESNIRVSTRDYDLYMEFER